MRAEQFFVTSMVANDNDRTVFVTRPVSAVIRAIAALMIVWPLVKSRRSRG